MCPDSSAADEFTRDSLFAGGLWVLQPRQGYRFSMDAVLLAHFIAPKQGERLLDLGTGCGILPLILSYRHPGLGGVAVEIQPRLAALARENFAVNGLDAAWQVIEGDVGDLAAILPTGGFDWAISNPPYRPAGTGRRNPLPEAAAARHELTADLPAVIGAMRRALKTGGRAALVYPATRLAPLIAALKSQGLEPKRLQVVYSHPGDTGRLVLVEARKGGGEEMTVLPPFSIYQSPGGQI
ncbi:MAG: tRNA1(Val) (adenine(37)-N6)-methyltransferase, partial [Desulfobacteraceae bacterium]|nr:tRNA1(Val) (adenine(37)-N6)-methyltransferase [Desulfobacteraceae bacterium]